MAQPQSEFNFKILLLGDPAVGKTSLVTRFVHGKFTKDYLVTVGMEPYSQHLTIGRTPISLSIWDIAGQKEFLSLRTIFFKGAKATVLTFDLSRRETFENIWRWHEETDKATKGQYFLLVGNKNDLKDQRQVYRREGNQLARELDRCIGYIETSALTGYRVEEAFVKLAQKILVSEQEKLRRI